MAIAHNEISVLPLLQASHPLEVDLRSRNLALDFPDHLLVRGNFDHAVTTARGDQGISVIQTHGPIDTGLDEIIPDHFSILRHTP